MSADYHVPVLVAQVLHYLAPSPGEILIDCNVGGGAHASEILRTMRGRGRFLGIDRDPEAIEAAGERLSAFGEMVTLRCAPFSRLGELAREEGITAAHGVFFDFGVSSAQLDRAGRGMSHRSVGPLDLRMDQSSGEPASALLARWSEREIEEVLRRYGEEPRARAIARAIARAPQRPATTAALAEIVTRFAPHPPQKTLSRVFQGLRIATNGEIEEIEGVLPQAANLLAPGGRLVAIAYHSLEDRAVKTFFQRESRECLCPPQLPACRCGHVASLEILTRRAVRPDPEEVTKNRRSRSARLRAARRLPKNEDPNRT